MSLIGSLLGHWTGFITSLEGERCSRFDVRLVFRIVERFLDRFGHYEVAVVTHTGGGPYGVCHKNRGVEFSSRVRWMHHGKGGCITAAFFGAPLDLA